MAGDIKCWQPISMREKFTCLGWKFDDLVSQPGFIPVPRVSADNESLTEAIRKHEENGVPLVIEGFHKLTNWPVKLFDPKWLVSSGLEEIPVRNVHNGEDKYVTISDFITTSRQIPVFTQPDETERLYGKDAPCPDRWKEWLSSVIPCELLEDSRSNYLTNLPKEQRIETLMCYIGVGDTFTPIHKDLCASSGQNLMCFTENGGSSFWFMTKSSSARQLTNHFLALNKVLEHETHIMSLKEARKAATEVPIYIVEQRVGDLVLVPPRSWHQVVNSGGLTIKTSWSRMTFRGLQTALYHELPLYRRVCRLETYRIKSTIYHTVLRWTADLLTHSNHFGAAGIVKTAKSLAIILRLFDSVLLDEYCLQHGQLETIHPKSTVTVESELQCDFCGADIFQSFLYCKDCVKEKENDIADGFILCPGCYVEGRTCKCQSLKPAQWRTFVELLEARRAAHVALHHYWEHDVALRPVPLQEERNMLHTSLKKGIFAACILLAEHRKSLKPKNWVKRCSIGKVHDASGDACVSCKDCHRTCCFYHILHTYTLHSVQVLHRLRHDQTIHESHKVGKSNFQQKWEAYEQQEKEGKQPEDIQLSDLAQVFTTCKPLRPAYVRPGWYDEKIEIIYNAEGNLDHLKPGNSIPAESVENVNSKMSESKGSNNKRKGLFLDCVLVKTPTDSGSFVASSMRTFEGETDSTQCTIPCDSSIQLTQKSMEDRRKRRKNSSPTPSSSTLAPTLNPPLRLPSQINQTVVMQGPEAKS